MKLNAKQTKFCDYYLETGNASEAYRKAYPRSAKWKEESVWSKASSLLKTDKVQERVKELQVQLNSKAEIKKEEILEMLKSIMYADIRDFLEIKGGFVIFKDSSSWTKTMAMQVESVKQTKEGIEIKLNGRSWSINRICKMLGYDEAVKAEVTLANAVIGDE